MVVYGLLRKGDGLRERAYAPSTIMVVIAVPHRLRSNLRWHLTDVSWFAVELERRKQWSNHFTWPNPDCPWKWALLVASNCVGSWAYSLCSGLLLGAAEETLVSLGGHSRIHEVLL
jgi:hypothetical protein